MNVWPVVERELREQARQAATYWLRLGGAAGLLGFGFTVTMDRGLGYEQGDRLFAVMHWVMFCCIWGLIPILTADCISRERREGTLGLLFLTPLTAVDVILAKGLAYGLRGASLGIAAVPVLVVPILMGGVDWRVVVGSLVFNLSSFLWALAAGLLASSRQTTLHRALVGAYLRAGLFWLALVLGIGGVVQLAFPNRPVWFYHGRGIFGEGVLALLNFQEWTVQGQTAFPGGGGVNLFAFYSAVLGGTLLAFSILVSQAARNLRRLIVEQPPSAARVKIQAIFCTPRVALGLFRRWMRWRLERNPIGWLEQRTWQSRLVIWSWLAVLISMYSLILHDRTFFWESFAGLQQVLCILFLLSMAATTCGSFRRERESRVLELLLISPLATRLILWGRLWGLWSQFLPALALLVGVWVYVASWSVSRVWTPSGLSRSASTELMMLLRFLVASLVMPVIGLYFSLRCNALITAFAWAVGCIFLVPWIAYMLVVVAVLPLLSVFPALEAASRGMWTSDLWGWFGLPVACWILLGLVLGYRLHRNLDERRFALSSR